MAEQKEPRHMLLRETARGVTPAILLAALYLALGPENAMGGNGLAGGALGALAFVLHAALNGAAATLKAFPFAAQRIVMALGIVLIVGASFMPAWRAGPELGLMFCVIAGFATAYCAVAARAHELRGGDW